MVTTMFTPISVLPHPRMLGALDSRGWRLRAMGFLPALVAFLAAASSESPAGEASTPVAAAPSRSAASPSAEWTLEAARRAWQPMVRPVAHVGIPGYSFQAGVLWDGGLVFGPLDSLDSKAISTETAALGRSRLHLSVAFGDPPRFADRRGSARPELHRFLEEGRLPIPHVVVRDGDLEWEELVFARLAARPFDAWSDPRADDVLAVEARFQVRNLGSVRRAATLRLHLGETGSIQFGYKCRQKDETAPALPFEFDPPLVLIDGRIRLAFDEPSRGKLVHEPAGPLPAGSALSGTARSSVPSAILPSNVGRENAIPWLRWDSALEPGEAATLRLVLPYGLLARDEAPRIREGDPDLLLEEVRRGWRGIVGGQGQIVTPDPFVNDYLAAVAGQMAEQVAFRRNSKLWMLKTSPNHYELYWPCNAAKALPAFDCRGLGGLTRRVLQGFLDRQTDDVLGLARGPMGRDVGLRGEGYAKVQGFLGNFGDWTANPLLISHGLGLWALARHYRITRDDDWLRSGANPPLDAMLAGSDWVATQRRRTCHEAGGRRSANWGLLPAASAHDWLAGSTIFNDAYCVYGMAEVARLLAEIGHARAAALAAEVEAYRTDIRDRYAEASAEAKPIPLADGSTLAYVPRMIGEPDWRSIDWTYTGYGPLRAGAWRAIDPLGPLVSRSLAFLEDGMPRGEGPYFAAQVAALADARDGVAPADVNWALVSDPGAERHHLWRHYVEYETMWPIGGPLFLERDDLPRFFEWLFHNLVATIHAEWRVGVESIDGVPSCSPGDGERWQCIRNMFVREHDTGGAQSLWLLQAVPRSWLRPSDRIRVRDMPTAFGGSIDLALEVSEDASSIRIETEWRGLAVSPKAIRLRLHAPEGRRLHSVLVDGRVDSIGATGSIELATERAASHAIVAQFE